MPDPDENTIMNGATKLKADNCGHINKQRYKGTITGNIRAWLDTNNDGMVSDVPINGIAVALYDRDYGWNADDFLGSVYTDANGQFSISVDVCQNFRGINQPEGGDLELFVEVLSHHHNPDIKVRNRIGATIRGLYKVNDQAQKLAELPNEETVGGYYGSFQNGMDIDQETGYIYTTRGYAFVCLKEKK